MVKITNYRKALCSLLFFFAIVSVYAQQFEVNGTIVDANSQPLPGANILEKGTANGAQTNFDGKFSLNVSNKNAVLTVSYIGFKTQEVVLGAKNTITVVLQEDASSLDEVVVIGYGTQKRSDVTGAVTSLDPKLIEIVPASNVTQVLQGRLPGVIITPDGGGAEGNANIQIRGQNSLTANNQPLIILDGIPFSGGLSSINPNDIGSFDVLKDASSTAIYGARGANGVILITTKKGKKGKPTISYSGNVSMSEITNLPDLMDGETYYNRKLEFFPGQAPETVFSQTELDNYERGEFVNWAKEGTQTGIRQEHNISISGGSENSSYFISTGINNTKGVAVNDEFKRINLRINYDTKINDWLRFGTNTLLGHIDRSGTNVDFQYSFGRTRTLRMSPLANIRNPDGSLARYPLPDNTFYANVLEPTQFQNNDIEKSVNTNNYLEVKLPIDGLSYRLNTGYTSRGRIQETYQDRTTKTGFENGGAAQASYSDVNEWTIENILNYNKEFGKHNIFLTGLYSTQETNFTERSTSGRGFPNDIRTYYQFGSAEVLTAEDTYRETAFVSQMFRANYGYDSRYLFTFTVRRDGFSGFGSDTKYGVFPTAALAWNIANESFMESADFVNTLKLRASYGENGNQAIGAYASLAPLSEEFYLDQNYATAPGFFPETLADPALGWETSKSFNFGLDFGFLKNRIQGSMDYYTTKTSDLLLNRAISPINGAPSITQNIGNTESSGFELSISSVNISKPDFSWTTDFNFSLNRTKLVDVGLYDDLGNPIDDLANRWFIGQPADVFFGFVFDGIWQTGDDVANSGQTGTQPGDVRIRDVDGDGEITTDDRLVLGTPQPDWLAGMNNTITYKNLTLNVFIHTVQGASGFNPLWTPFYNNYQENIYNYNFWSETNPTNDFPANRDDTGGARPLGDASFFRLKDITLSYSLNEDVLSKLKLKNFEVFINAKNVATITDYEFGWDPEFNSTDNDSRAIPFNRSFSLGLRASF